MTSRHASHAGSWYPRSAKSLQSQLDAFITATDSSKHSVKHCRVIISPHAGYSYSGQTAAYGFKALDWTSVQRVFVLGPSHHFYLRYCALSSCTEYETPFGPLSIDTDMIRELKESRQFDDMALEVDEDEHSIEMQLPYLKLVMPEDRDIPVVPILVGNLDHEGEKHYGSFLARYLADKANAFVISSDFCHWGKRFAYTYYHAPPAAPAKSVQRSQISSNCPLWKSIETVDQAGIALIKSGSHKEFTQYLASTKNTICGRHPIGIILAAMEAFGTSNHFEFLDYRQSEQITSVSDSSVSYASAYCCP